MNKVILVGRLSREPELSFTAGKGTAVTKFNVAVKRRFKTEGQPEADFINCTAFGKSAEIIAEHFIKGQEIAIEGEIRTGSYETQEGSKRYTTEVIINQFDFVGSKKVAGSFNNVDDGLTYVEGDTDIPF